MKQYDPLAFQSQFDSPVLAMVLDPSHSRGLTWHPSAPIICGPVTSAQAFAVTVPEVLRALSQATPPPPREASQDTLLWATANYNITRVSTRTSLFLSKALWRLAHAQFERVLGCVDPSLPREERDAYRVRLGLHPRVLEGPASTPQDMLKQVTILAGMMLHMARMSGVGHGYPKYLADRTNHLGQSFGGPGLLSSMIITHCRYVP